MLSRFLFRLMCRLGLYAEVKRAILEQVREEEQSRILERIEARVREASEQTDRRVRRLESLIAHDQRHAEDIGRLDRALDLERIGRHVRERIAATTLRSDPLPHLVVPDALPADFYALLLDAMPPQEFFAKQKYRRNYATNMRVAPTFSRRVWSFLDGPLAREAIMPAVLEKFAAPLDAHFADLFGPDFVDEANSLPAMAEEGRIMVGSPGYHLEPHLDPIRVLFTVMLYVPNEPAIAGQEAFGTQFFRITGGFEATDHRALYPEREGLACEPVFTAPYKANHLMVFLNRDAAHGAHIPKGAAPKGFERRAYRFYIRPEPEPLAQLVARLPAAAKARWRDEGVSADGPAAIP
jgi:hypothetical protein